MPPRKGGKRARAKKQAQNEAPIAKVAKKDNSKALEVEKEQQKGKLTVLTVGMGDMGQLGLGEDIAERSRPAIVTKLDSEDVTSVQCGGMHNVALTQDGKAFSWGCNDEGALGRATKEGEDEEAFPAPVVFPSPKERIIQVSAGDSHSAFLHENGSILCSGAFRDSKGVIGLTASGQREGLPIRIWTSSSLEKGTSVSSGNEHVAFLTDKGNLFTFGVGEQGQLGRVASCFADRGGRRGLKAILTPERVYAKWGPIESVFCGGYHSFAISKSRVAYAWGLNNYGQLGVGDAESYFVPRKLTKGERFCAFSGAQHHSLALGRNGRVYACGRAEYGRLGLGEKAEERHEFVEIPQLASVVDVACAGSVSFAVTQAGRAHAWGMGTNMQLSVGADDDDVFTPQPVKGKNVDSRSIVHVSVGGQHASFLAE